MGAAIGQILPLAVGVALSPVPIIAVALMLMSQRARLNGPVFVIGWLIGLAVIGVIVLAVAGPGDASSHGKPATWVSVLKLVLGVLLLLLAVRQWHGRPRYLPDHRGQADRRRHRRLQQLSISAGKPLSRHLSRYHLDRCALCNARTYVHADRRSACWRT